MKTEQKQAIRMYLLDAINLDGYDQYKGLQMNEHDRLNAVYKIFKSEYCYPENLRRYGNEVNLFSQWLMGLPSCFNIDFQSHEILKLGRKWGFIPLQCSSRVEDNYINNWFNRIANNFFQNLNRKSLKK